MKTLTIIGCWLILAFTISGCLWAYIKEKKRWNKGKCDKCGCKWYYLTSEYTGERVYACSGKWCRNYCRISFKSIDGGNKK